MLEREPETNLQPTLFEMAYELRSIVNGTMAEQAASMARTLSRRELPMFYFIEAGDERGVPAKTVRGWNLNRWPITLQPTDGKIMLKNAIYVLVSLRLSKYPEDETYREATKRLLSRIHQLLDRGFTKNQIAQQMRMSFRTLKNLRERTRRDTGETDETAKKPNHCPWKLLERLENAETKITRQMERQKEMEGLRIIHEGADYGDPELEPDLPPPDKAILVGEKCRKCGGGWPNLREDGRDGWDRPIMVCMKCGAENPLALDAEDPDEVDFEEPKEEEFIERYAPCRHCEAYWNHLKKERADRWNNTIYLCVRCATINRVKPKRTRTRMF